MRKVAKCCECGKKRDNCREVARLLDGSIEWCCRQCWGLSEFALFFPDRSTEAELQRIREKYFGETPRSSVHIVREGGKELGQGKYVVVSPE